MSTNETPKIKTPISRAQELVAEYPGNLAYNPFSYSEGLARKLRAEYPALITSGAITAIDLANTLVVLGKSLPESLVWLASAAHASLSSYRLTDPHRFTMAVIMAWSPETSEDDASLAAIAAVSIRSWYTAL